MYTIFADKLFEDKDLLKSLQIENGDRLTLDFSHVNDFSIKNLYALLDLQKVALFNNADVDIKNTTPVVEKVLYETGIYKALNGYTTTPILPAKRFSFS